LNELIKIKNHRLNNFITTELISDNSTYRGISAYWFNDEFKVSKEKTPVANELCSIRIEGNYELEPFKCFWIYFETWDSNQNGVSKKEHINSNKLCFGQIEKIHKQESNYIDCRFRVNKSLSIINEIKPKPISEKWKTIIIDFAKTDFTGSLLTVFKFDKYLNASCQTDGGPYYNFVFEIGDQIHLRQIVESDMFEDPLILLTNEIVDLELENILKFEEERRIKAFRLQDKDFNKFLFYVDGHSTNKLSNEIAKANKIILRKGWKREQIVDIKEIETTINKMKDYH